MPACTYYLCSLVFFSFPPQENVCPEGMVASVPISLTFNLKNNLVDVLYWLISCPLDAQRYLINHKRLEVGQSVNNIRGCNFKEKNSVTNLSSRRKKLRKITQLLLLNQKKKKSLTLTSKFKDTVSVPNPSPLANRPNGEVGSTMQSPRQSPSN